MLSVDLELGTASGIGLPAAEEHSTKHRESESQKQSSADETAMGNNKGNDNTNGSWPYIPPSRLGLSKPSRSSLHNLTRLTSIGYLYLREEGPNPRFESRPIPLKVRIDGVNYDCAEVLHAQNYGTAASSVIPHSESLLRTIDEALIDDLKAALFAKRTEPDFLIDSSGMGHLLH